METLEDKLSEISGLLNMAVKAQERTTQALEAVEEVVGEMGELIEQKEKDFSILSEIETKPYDGI